jgi:hypothetical protein
LIQLMLLIMRHTEATTPIWTLKASTKHRAQERPPDAVPVEGIRGPAPRAVVGGSADDPQRHHGRNPCRRD